MKCVLAPNEVEQMLKRLKKSELIDWVWDLLIMQRGEDQPPDRDELGELARFYRQ